jgi:hypothetical protein
MVIIAGAEWNIPPWNGEEHATVLVARSRAHAGGFKRSSTTQPERHDPSVAAAGLRGSPPMPSSTVSFAGHLRTPEPRRRSQHGERPGHRRLARRQRPLIGFAELRPPGHKPIGSYAYKEVPMTAGIQRRANRRRVGHAARQASTSGRPTRLPTSHREPLEPRRLLGPENSRKRGSRARAQRGRRASRLARGQLLPITAGSSARVELRVNTDGLSRAAGAGESIAVADATLVAQLTFHATTAWRSGPNPHRFGLS